MRKQTKTKGLGSVMSTASPKAVNKYKDQLYKEIRTSGTGRGAESKAAAKTGIPTSSVYAARSADLSRESRMYDKAGSIKKLPGKITSYAKKVSSIPRSVAPSSMSKKRGK